MALAAFVKDTAPDLQFLQELRNRKCIDENCFAFTELFDANGSDLPGQVCTLLVQGGPAYAHVEARTWQLTRVPDDPPRQPSFGQGPNFGGRTSPLLLSTVDHSVGVPPVGKQPFWLAVDVSSTGILPTRTCPSALPR